MKARGDVSIKVACSPIIGDGPRSSLSVNEDRGLVVGLRRLFGKRSL